MIPQGPRPALRPGWEGKIEKDYLREPQLAPKGAPPTPSAEAAPAGVSQARGPSPEPALPPTSLSSALLLLFLFHTCEGGPRPACCARAAAQPSLLHTRQHTHHSTYAHGPISATRRSYTQFCASVCVKEEERAWQPGVEEDELTLQPALPRSPGG